MASTGFKQGGAVLKEFKAKRSQLWQYLNTSVDYFLRAVGLRSTVELSNPEALPLGTQASCTKLENKSFTYLGDAYDVYSLKSWMFLSGSNAYAEFLGLVNVEEGFLIITKQSTNIVGDDISGLIGGYTNTAVANSATPVEASFTSIVTSATGSKQPALAYINQDPTISGIDDNYMFMILDNTSAVGGDDSNIDAEVYVDIEFAVNQGTKVEFIQF